MAVGFSTLLTYQVGDTPQDEAPRVITLCHEGDSTRFPVSRHRSEPRFQVSNLFCNQVAVGGDQKRPVDLVRIDLT
jgi:hypothetical protein